METKPSVDARRSERQAHEIGVTMLGKSNGFEYQEPAHTIDVSEHGLGILTDNPVDATRPLSTGQIVYLYGAREQALGYFRIVWARGDSDGAPTRAGLQFLN